MMTKTINKTQETSITLSEVKEIFLNLVKFGATFSCPKLINIKGKCFICKYYFFCEDYMNIILKLESKIKQLKKGSDKKL